MAQKNAGSLGMLYHPLQGELLENPYPFYERARKEEPIFFSQELDAWVVTRYDDALTILNQPDIFSSRNTLRPVVKYSSAVLTELSKGYPLVPNTIDSDGKEHTRFRSAVSRAFIPRRVRLLEPFIKEVATSLVDTFIHDHKVEIISQFAYPLPLEVVLFVIGVPKEDMTVAKTLSDSLLTLVNAPLSEEQQVECARGFVNFQHYCIQLVNDRRRAPREDLISDLLETPPGERPFDDAQLANLLTSMVVAGHATLTHLIGNGLALLLEHPQRWQALCSDPACIPQAIEEILRYDAPAHVRFRTTTQTVTVGGITLPPEASLMIVFGSANRDERQFRRPDQFDIERSPNRHLSFGHGVHFCAGAFLARREAHIAFETLCQRLPHLRLAPQQMLSHVPILRQRGFRRLEAVW